MSVQRLGQEWIGTLPAFHPRVPWLGGDLQTLRNHFLPPRSALPPPRIEHISIGEAGALRLAINGETSTKNPSVLLLHGLGGCEDSAYMLHTAMALHQAGYRVARLNLRGAGPGAAHARGLYHAGLTADLRAVLTALAKTCDADTRWVVMGFSLGAHASLRLACEPDLPANLAAVFAVSAPLDLSVTCDRMEAPRNRLYHRYMIRKMQKDASAFYPQSDLAAIPSVRAFDDQITAPAHGFVDAADYYAQMSVLSHLDNLQVPSLLLHGYDDPWIPADMYQRDWTASAPVDVVLTRGGHVGFHGIASRRPYYVDLLFQLLERI